MAELQDCPFCGGLACVYEHYQFDGYQGESPTHYVKCTRCGARVESSEKDKAIATWNSRIYKVDERLKEAQAEIERLQHILNCYALQYGTVVDKDVVEVVRCKDCRFRHSSEFCECRDEDAYCSEGERIDS